MSVVRVRRVKLDLFLRQRAPQAVAVVSVAFIGHLVDRQWPAHEGSTLIFQQAPAICATTREQIRKLNLIVFPIAEWADAVAPVAGFTDREEPARRARKFGNGRCHSTAS